MIAVRTYRIYCFYEKCCAIIKERSGFLPLLFAVCALRLLLHKHGGDEQRGEARDDGRSRTGVSRGRRRGVVRRGGVVRRFGDDLDLGDHKEHILDLDLDRDHLGVDGTVELQLDPLDVGALIAHRADFLVVGVDLDILGLADAGSDLHAHLGDVGAGVAKLDVHLTDAVGEVGPGRVVLVVGIERKPRLLVRELVALGGVDAVGEVAGVDVRALVRRHLDARPRLMQRDVGLLCRDEHARQRGGCHSRKQG